MLSGHFHALILWSKQDIFCFQTNDYLNCVFISYTPQRLYYHNTNYSKNIVLFGKCLRKWLPLCLLNRKSLEFSRAVTISRLSKRAEARSLHVNTDVFNTVHRKRHRFLAFFECILSKNIEMNIDLGEGRGVKFDYGSSLSIKY